jgi:replication factor A1
MNGLPPASELTEVRLRDLRTGLAPVSVTARVVSVNRRQVTRRTDGSRRWILAGLLSDGTATVRFTWWDPPAEGIDRGTVLRAANVQVREFRGTPELSFGWNTRVAPASELELPAVPAEEMPLRLVHDLGPRDEGFRLDARVLDIQARTVTVGSERRQVFGGRMADRSGRIRFTSWVDFRLQPGEAVRLSGAYVRSYRGLSELTLDERSHVERIDGAALPEASSLPAPALLPIGRAARAGVDDELLVEGTVLGLVPPSGVVYRCPTCQRLLQKGLCRVHGTVEGSPDLRARVVLDDGTGVATVNLARPLAEALGGRTLPECLERLKRQPDPGALEEELRARLFGQRLRVRGSGRTDDFGLTVFASEAVPVAVDPGPALDELARRLGARR